MKMKRNKRGMSIRSAHEVHVDDEIECREEILLGNSIGASAQNTRDEKYSMKYRIIKTALLIFAWISLGLSLEIMPRLIISNKNSKFYLSKMKYSVVSFELGINDLSYLMFSLIFGIVLEKITKNYCETLMAIGSAVFALGWKKFYEILF